MKERLRILREELHLSRAAFGEKMGVSGDVINNLERGRVELKDPMFSLIVRTFGVSPDWLRDGSGSMFAEKWSALDDLVAEFDLSEADRILERFLKLNKSQRDAVTAYIKDVAQALAASEPEDISTEAAEAAYREVLGIAPPTASTASSTTEDIPKRKTGEAG